MSCLECAGNDKTDNDSSSHGGWKAPKQHWKKPKGGGKGKSLGKTKKSSQSWHKKW